MPEHLTTISQVPFQPEPAQEIFGLAVAPAARALDDLACLQEAFKWSVLPPHIAGETVRAAATVLPYAEHLRQGGELSPADIQPITWKIVSLLPPAKQDLAGLADAFGFGGVIRRKVTAEFPAKARAFWETPEAPEIQPVRRVVEAGLGTAALYGNIVAEYKPREQFVGEIATLLADIRSAARSGHDARTGQPLDKPATAVTANDAGRAMRQVFGRLFQDPAYAERTPMLRALLVQKLGEKGLRSLMQSVPKQSRLAAVAPEIIDSLEQVVPPAARDSIFLASVRKHYGGLRWAATLSTLAPRSRLQAFSKYVPRLLINTRDALPQNGAALHQGLQQAHEFIAPRTLKPGAELKQLAA